MSLEIKDMLLIEEPTIQILKDEIMKISHWFVLPSFVMALCLEYFSDLKFGEVVKKLILILAFMSVFFTIHSEGVNLSFKASEEILKKVSPRNIFLRSWTEVKVKTKEDVSWNWLQKFAIPNINDLVGTALFVLSKVFIWILKLIYSTVYHLTYVFAPLTAILYFFPITRGSISGTIQSSLWCMLMPIVLVSILAIVGNSIQVPSKDGALAIISIDHIIWVFGVTLLILMTPVLTIGILRGGGVAMSGSAIGALMTNSAMKFVTSIPGSMAGIKSTSKVASKIGEKSLFRPSVKELLKKESNANNPMKEKLKQLNQKGGIRNPFKEPKGIDERLAKMGMTRGEAHSLSKISSRSNNEGKSGTNKTNGGNLKAPLEKQKQETFLFDKKYWNKITPEHREGIRDKYGIKSELPTPNKLYRPIPEHERRGPRSSSGSLDINQGTRKPETNKLSHTLARNLKKGERNEIRNI